MKKLGALLCTAALTLGMTTSALANPSIITIATETYVVSAETQVTLPETMRVEVREVDTTRYTSEKVVHVVETVNEQEEYISVTEILEVLEVPRVDETTGEEIEIRTTADNVINPDEYEPITYFADLVLTDGVNVHYNLDGEVVEVTATLTLEALKDTVAENLLVMQLDPETGEIYFIEISEDDLDPETGEVTITFPCLGPFCFIEKAQMEELQSELMSELQAELETEA